MLFLCFGIQGDQGVVQQVDFEQVVFCVFGCVGVGEFFGEYYLFYWGQVIIFVFCWLGYCDQVSVGQGLLLVLGEFFLFVGWQCFGFGLFGWQVFGYKFLDLVVECFCFGWVVDVYCVFWFQGCCLIVGWICGVVCQFFRLYLIVLQDSLLLVILFQCV